MMKEEILVLSILVFCNAVSLKAQREQNEFHRMKMRTEELGDCKHCGLSFEKPSGRPHVVNGSNVASVAKYPWMVSLVDSDCDEVICGGAILNKNTILTAAHCVWSFVGESCKKSNHSCEPSKNFRIKFFTPPWYTAVKPKIRADRIMIHPRFFRGEGKPHDIALIKLAQPIRCNTLANPICLPPPEVVLKKGQRVRFSGYGKHKPSDSRGSTILHEGELKVTNMSRCLAMGIKKENIHCIYCMRRLIGHTPCYGDSGGSMFGRLYAKGPFVTLGVLALQSSDTCHPYATVVYTSVVHNLAWIKKKLADDLKNNTVLEKGKNQ